MQHRQISATVCDLAGKSMELKLPLQVTVAQVKSMIDEALDIPVLYQKLVVGNQVLCDSKQLVDYCQSNLDLLVTLLLCWDEVRSALEGESTLYMFQALEAIKRLGPKAGEHERCAVEILLHHPSDRIRVAAVTALGSIFAGTDVYRISLLCQCLADPCSRVRSATVSELSHLASKLDIVDCAFEALSELLQHPEACVRKSAVCVASRFKCKLDIRKVWIHVTPLIESVMPEVRATALEVLSQLAERGDQDALTVVFARLADPEACTRCAALTAIGCLAANKGDWNVVSLLIESFEDTDDDVRQAALDQLPRLVSKNDDRTIKTVAKCLDHENASVRMDVPSALLKVSSRGNECTLESVASRLAHLSPEVRQASLFALCHLAKGAEDSVVHAAAPYLEHVQPETRAVAMQVLYKCGTDIGTDTAIKKLKDKDGMVRKAAVDVVAKAALGDPNAIDRVSQVLQNPHPGIRLSGLHALSKIANQGNKQVIHKITNCLQDDSLDMRLAAVEALAHLSSPGDSAVLSALRACRQSEQARRRDVAFAVYEVESKLRCQITGHGAWCKPKTPKMGTSD